MPPDRNRKTRRRVCFVTGTRADFGLMQTSLQAIEAHRQLELQLIVTGIHTHRSRGYTADEIRAGGWRIDQTIRWQESSEPVVIAGETGRISGELASAFETLQTDIVLVVGDRVEAFAAASAGHLSGRVVAHVHGGDRAMGQADDSLRHAISRLAHLHLPATPGSAERLLKMGEEWSRIEVVGAPGIDAIGKQAATRAQLIAAEQDYPPRSFTLLLLHPTDDSTSAENDRTTMLIRAVTQSQIGPIVALMPNNDPGAEGIVTALNASAARKEVHLITHLSRPIFLGLMRDCRLMIGNSSAGIIEAGSFGTPVVNIGPRQTGRERGSNVVNAMWTSASIRRVIGFALKFDRSLVADNPYDQGGAGKRIADELAKVRLDADFRHKLICY